MVRSITEVGSVPPGPASSTSAKPGKMSSISAGSGLPGSPWREAVLEMIGRPSSLQMANATGCLGMRTPTVFLFDCTTRGTYRVASKMKQYGPGKNFFSVRYTSLCITAYFETSAKSWQTKASMCERSRPLI